MDLHLVARLLLAVFCGLQGLATMALDLNRTHAAHPKWLGHARFHVVWQTASIAFLSVVEIVLICMHAPMEAERFYLGALLACVPIVGFFAAVITRSIYGGTLSDPGGIPPVPVTLRGRRYCVDMNLVAEIAGLLTVALIVALYRFSGGPAAL